MWVVPLVGAEPADTHVHVHVHVHLLGQEVAALLHEWADGKPHAVQEGELVLQVIRVRVTRVRVLPFIRREPATQTPGASWEVCKQNFETSKHMGWTITTYALYSRRTTFDGLTCEPCFCNLYKYQITPPQKQRNSHLQPPNDCNRHWVHWQQWVNISVGSPLADSICKQCLEWTHIFCKNF
jgi:hypothetical protein